MAEPEFAIIPAELADRPEDGVGIVADRFGDRSLPAVPERLPDEPDSAYELFLQFISLPPGSRTITQVSSTLGLSVNQVVELSSRYNWTGRARQYDRAVLETARAAVAASLVSAIGDIVRSVSEVARRITEAANGMEITPSAAAKLFEAMAGALTAASSITGSGGTADSSQSLSDVLRAVSVFSPSIVIQTVNNSGGDDAVSQNDGQ